MPLYMLLLRPQTLGLRAQVLLTEELTGSLRKLKPCVFLARERFTSLQKRAIIEPRVAVRHKRVAKKVQWG